MSQKIADELRDLMRHGGCIVAQCQCGRAGLFSIGGLDALFRSKGWPTDIRSVGGRLRCTGCGKRGQRAYYAQPPVPDVIGLCTIVQPPRGINPLEWAKADDRERKRLIHRVRGSLPCPSTRGSSSSSRWTFSAPLWSGRGRRGWTLWRCVWRCAASCPFCPERWPLTQYWSSAAQPNDMGRSQSVTASFNGICHQLREAGRYPEEAITPLAFA